MYAIEGQQEREKVFKVGVCSEKNTKSNGERYKGTLKKRGEGDGRTG